MKKFIPTNAMEGAESDLSDDEINIEHPPDMDNEQNSDASHSTDNSSDEDSTLSEGSESGALNDSSDISIDSEEHDSDDSDSDSSSSFDTDVTLDGIFGTKTFIQPEKICPPEIHVESAVVDVCFHPELPIVAAGTMDGECIIYNYEIEKCEEKTRLSPHRKACRQICFSEDGSVLYSVSKDKSIAIADSETGKLILRNKDAHESPIYSFQPITKDMCASGDDDGIVKLWDLRKKTPVMSFKCGEQTVNSLISCERNRYLAAAVADGSIAGFNLRERKIEKQSEMYESELTCFSLIRSNTRLCVGSGSGIIYFYVWGDFGYHLESYPGHPDQIQCQLALTDKIILTGCEDGKIRALNTYPHSVFGVVGKHTGFGVENMSLSHDGIYLATCSMDDVIRFWNIEYLYDQEMTKKKKEKKKAIHKNLSSAKVHDPSFFLDFPNKKEYNNQPEDPRGPVEANVEEEDHLDLS